MSDMQIINKMSGHSHFSTIKHKKEITDQKRSKIFSKLAQQILVSAREKGSDPDTNAGLRLAIEKAKQSNMPKDNIERAIKKGSGELEGEKLEEVFYEAYGPGGIAVIIEGITDNKNRTLAEIKQILSQNQGKLAGSGSVKWMFERKGVIVINFENSDSEKKDELELKIIEAGADDISWNDGVLYIYTKPEDLENVKKGLEEQGIEIESFSLDLVAKEPVDLQEKEKIVAEKLFEALDENDATQEIYSNLK